MLKWLDKVENIQTYIEEEKIKPLPESTLNQYIHLPHKMFLDDNISIDTQKEFEICYSLSTDRIVIPVRDEIGTLIGDTSRATKQEDIDAGYKYLPHYPYPKSKILYGLNKTLPYIKEANEVIVVEAPKGVMQLWDMNIKNVVAAQGHTLSDTQIEKLIKLNVPIVIAFDKVDKSRTKYYNEMKDNINKIANELKLFTTVYVILDKWNILDDKESPCDDRLSWEYLYKHKILIK